MNHFDFGVPWDEVRDELPFPEEVQNAINIARDNKSADTRILLTATPTDQSRENLALYWNNNGTHQALPSFWAGRRFNDTEVVNTYIKYCRRLIDEIEPDYFAYGIETNAAFRADDPAFSDFLELAESVYTALKTDYPQLPLFLSIQDQSFNNSKQELLQTSLRLIAFSDYIAISTYPFFYYEDLDRDANPELFTDNWLSDFRNLDQNKPFAISETGFAAQDLVIQDLAIDVKATEDWQAAYLTKLFQHGNELEAEFISWFIYRDYDLLYDKTQNPPDIFRIWKDNGLLDGNGNERRAYAIWKEWLSRPLD